MMMSNAVAWIRRAVWSLALLAAVIGCSRETSHAPVARSLGSPGGVENAKDGASAASVAKTTCFNEKPLEIHTTVAGPLSISCNPNVGWSKQATDALSSNVRGAYAPFTMTLNGESLLEEIAISAELVKKRTDSNIG